MVRHNLTKQIGTKSGYEIYWGAKSLTKFLGGLKRKF